MSVVANVAINVDSRNAVSQLRQVQTQAGATERAFDSLRGAAAALGVGLAFGKVIQDVKELDTNIRRLATVGVDVAKINPALTALGKELEGVASKAELAAASYQAASAGFSDTAGNIEILRAATKAAVGGLADASAVTEVLVKTLNAYGMSGRDATKITDSISKAVEVGNQEWSDYTSQLGRVVSVSALAGVSIDQVNAFIAAATKNGATAEIAFTGLGAALQTLLQPTKESQDAAKALGIQWNIAGLQAKGLPGLLADLATKQDANKEAVARLLGSQEALRGVLSANAKAGKDYKMILELLGGAAGKTQSDFDTMKTTLENQLKGLDTAFKNLSESLGIAFGPTLANAIGQTAAVINSIADALNAIPGPAKTAAAEAIKLIVQMVLLKKAIEGIIALRAAFVAAMAGMATQTTAAGAAAVTSSSAFALYTNNTRALAAQSAAATPILLGLRAALQSIAAIGTIAVAVNVAVYGIQELISARAELDRLRGIRTKPGGIAGVYGGSATEEQKAAKRKVLDQIAAEREKNKPMEAIGAISGFGRGLGNTRAAILAEREREARAVLGLPTRAAAGAGAGTLPTPTPLVPYTPGGGRGGAAKAPQQAPENRTDALMTELRGLIAVGQAQDKIRDLQFQGRDVLAASVELEQELGQIERDRIEALKGASYETERTIINKIAEAKVTDAKLRTEDKIRDITNQRFQAELQIQQAIRDTIRPFEDIRNAQAEQNQYQQNYLRLVMEGMLPAEAQRIANFDQMIRQQLQAVEQQIDITQGAITEAKARGANVVELQKELDLLKKKRDAIKGEAAKGPGEGPSDRERLDAQIGIVKGQINELIDPVNQVVSAAKAIGDAFANSFKGLISGSMSAKEALRSFFEATASHFLDMAAQIIAKQIQMFILNTALSFFGGSMGGGGGGGAAAASSWGGSGFNTKAFTPGLKLFAEGGFVTRPTNALIGEAGEAEYVIPASKMRGAMERYANGARGDSVISGAGGGSTATTATNSGPLVVEVRAQMERINSVDYVTAEQFQAGIRQAAQQGAAQGEQRTLKRLQHSPATRRRVGV